MFFTLAQPFALAHISAIICLLPAGNAFAAKASADRHLGEGSEVEIGGEGTGQGKFDLIEDITFDGHNRLYVLDGIVARGKDKIEGNGLVQVFDHDGHFLNQFSVVNPKLNGRDAPARLAVDSRGHVFVTAPRAGLVREYDADGKLVQTLSVPRANTVAVRTVHGEEQVVVVPGLNPKEEVDTLTIFGPLGSRSVLKLSRAVQNCRAIRADAAGNLYLAADLNQIYKFDAQGKLAAVLGGGTRLRATDGSELIGTVAIDSRGNVYGVTSLTPFVSRFDPGLGTVTQRAGQFSAKDSWGPRLVLAVDRNDCLWVAAVMQNAAPKANAKGKKKKEEHHFRPCVMRLQPDYLDPQDRAVTVHSTLLMGFHLSIEDALPYDIAYDLAPITCTLVAKASHRQIQEADVDWVVYDIFKNAVAKGSFTFALKDGEEASHEIRFTPPRFGWYTVIFEARHQGELLAAVGKYVGVTPKYTNMVTLKAGESTLGWGDCPRQAFCGLLCYRAESRMNKDDAKSLQELEKVVEAARKYGLTLFVQFGNVADCTPENVRKVVTHFKGRVKYWEIMNEPNFFMGPAKYVDLIKQLYPLIKSIDPQAQVLGPTVCGIQLPWYEAFYKLGGKEFVDILSMHDYEGNESVDAEHWNWKLGELRKIMARYGDQRKPIWQTEEGSPGIRDPGLQAVRVLLHFDLLESLGIPSEHSMYYYLDQCGFIQFPSYLWSAAGPAPAALGMRIRQAMIQGRKYAGMLDFGPSGNKIFMGLRYVGDDGETITLRNQGTLDQRLTLAVSGGATVRRIDSFGNEQKLPVENGKVTLTVTMLPSYLRLEKGQQVVSLRIDFGPNYAGQAAFHYSADYQGSYGMLTDGIFESGHPSNPHLHCWAGDLPSLPQTLDIEFPYPRTVDRVLVFGARADNPLCALLDYDLQYDDGHGVWKTLKQVRAPVPDSTFVNIPTAPLTTVQAWYRDQNFFVNEFPPITTRKLRLVVLRTTYGRTIDKNMVKASGGPGANAPHLMLREVEIYGPRPAIELAVNAENRVLSPGVKSLPLTVTLNNHTATAVSGVIRFRSMPGWKTEPQTAAARLDAGGSARYKVRLLPAAGPLPVGPVPLVPESHFLPPTGLIPVEAALVGSNGEREVPLAFDVLNLEVPSWLRLTSREQGTTDVSRQGIPLRVNNDGLEPASGTLSVALTPAGGGAEKTVTAETAFGPIEPKKLAEVKLAPAGIDLARCGWKAVYRLTCNGLVETYEDALRPVQQWHVVGPFPNPNGKGYYRDLGPEKGVDLGARYPTGDGQTVGWMPVSSSSTGFVDLAEKIKPSAQVCAYAVLYVKSPTARKALISAATSCGQKTWLNGQLVMSETFPARRPKAHRQRAEVSLREGFNEVLIKVPNTQGSWGFDFDLCTADGQPMTDVVYAAEKK